MHAAHRPPREARRRVGRPQPRRALARRGRRCRGSILIRRGKGGRHREIGMDDWGWEELEPWPIARVSASASSMRRPAPQHDDQPAQPPTVPTVARHAHDRDDLLDGGRVACCATDDRRESRASSPASADDRRHRERAIRLRALPRIRPAQQGPQTTTSRREQCHPGTAWATERKRRAAPPNAVAAAQSHGGCCAKGGVRPGWLSPDRAVGGPG